MKDKDVNNEKEQMEQEVLTPENEEGFKESIDAKEDGDKKELLKDIEDLQKEKAELYQKLLRKQADFENYRKRVSKEKLKLREQALGDFVKGILPVLDNFERALANCPANKEEESLKNGVEMIYNQICSLLKEEGVEEIPGCGETFDPYVHEAVMQVESEEYDKNTVVEELQKGYKLKDRVLRASKVKVAK